ncbi:hypothetical protein BV898_09359 [Hypsibius exemplaris]|uniref:Small acidic protein-like domain-containing protein n=1 Tax=Hypsibius exemplaris TaxID=2072580 RepID=A0A1W0WMS2_HYPEX|nr:hypothetical protein BV898_09359 [Hypsibius exemplaris]
MDRQERNRNYRGNNHDRSSNSSRGREEWGSRQAHNFHRGGYGGDQRGHGGREGYNRQGNWARGDDCPNSDPPYSSSNRDGGDRRNPGPGSQRRSRSRSSDRSDKTNPANQRAGPSTQYNDRPYQYPDNVQRGQSSRGGPYRGNDRQQQAAARLEKFERMGPVAGPSQEELAKLPAYINPRAVNVNKMLEQQEKRKLLWGGSKAKKDTEAAAEAAPAEVTPTTPKATAAVWQNVTFSGDEDGRVANKFKKLMGLKETDPSAGSSSSGADAGSAPAPPHVKQEDLFRNLDRQYEMARLTAHTQKGVGLGFNSR